MIDIESLAIDRSEKTKDSQELWNQEINRAAKLVVISELTDGEFVRLVSASLSVAVYHSVTSWLTEFVQIQTHPSGFDLLARHVDQSDFSLRDWLEALFKMRQWLRAHNEPEDFVRSLGYIKCASLSLANTGGGTLGSSVVDMLDQFGVEKLSNK